MTPRPALRRRLLLPAVCASLLGQAGAWAQAAPDCVHDFVARTPIPALDIHDGIVEIAFLDDRAGVSDLGDAPRPDAPAGLRRMQPTGSDRIGAADWTSRHELCCDFAGLRARDTAKVAAVNVSYPFIRSHNYTLRGSLGYDARQNFDEAAISIAGARRAEVMTGALAADGRDEFGGGGVMNASFAISRGTLPAGDWVSDRNAALNANTGGNFTKAAWNVLRLQRLGRSSSLVASLAGQFASQNLDSSEKFVLGGPLGVRAYAQGEAAGDGGTLLNLEYRYELAEGLRLSGFIDHGSIRLAHNEWTSGAMPNRYSLSGAGVGLQWSQPRDYAVRANIALPLGNNPVRNIAGNDADGNMRYWLQAIKFF